MTIIVSSISIALQIVATIATSTAFADEYEDSRNLLIISCSDVVFVAELTEVKKRSESFDSKPPTRDYVFRFKPRDILRGEPSGEFLLMTYQEQEPKFEVGSTWLVAAERSTSKDWWVIHYMKPLDQTTLKNAKQIAALPSGWTIWEGKPSSPWAGTPDFRWKKEASESELPTCQFTGRPALMAGSEVEFTVEQIPAEDPDRRRDEKCDGKFKLTVRNPTKNPIVVPALRKDEESIRWVDSIVIITGSFPRLHPDAGKKSATTSVRLEPGESVDGEIDVLTLPQMFWPSACSGRVDFAFALGERRAYDSFNFVPTLHEPMRDKALEAIKKNKKQTKASEK